MKIKAKKPANGFLEESITNGSAKPLKKKIGSTAAKPIAKKLSKPEAITSNGGGAHKSAGKAKKATKAAAPVESDDDDEEEDDNSEFDDDESDSQDSEELSMEEDDSEPEDSVAEPTKKKKKKQVKSKEAKAAASHKASLAKLKASDPEFYKFLEQNDKQLLNFDAQNELAEEDSADDDDADAADDDDEAAGVADDGDDSDAEDAIVHKPSGEFEAGSDESDFEGAADDDSDAELAPAKGGTRTITLKLLKHWQTGLGADKIDLEIIKDVMSAVNSALLSISGEHLAGMPFRVEGAAVFNGVLQLCVLHLHPAVKRYLGLVGQTSKKPHKCKKWNKIRAPLKDYLIDLTKLLEHVSSTNILVVLLKHLHQISPMVASFASLTKPILKRLVALWSTSEETVRVLAFLSILRITRGQPVGFLNTILKAMYLSYVRNAKFVSPGTLPAINFMRRSLAEMFALDLNVSYQHVFLYIRQLAIHLRNALTLKKKDSFQAVYNWQFINSLRLWVELLCATASRTQLQPLVYPLVSIITGAIKLIPTAQYFPLRFHCVQMLVQLAKETHTFVPVLPFVLEVLNSSTFNRKHAKVSMKPLPFTCILRLNKAQLLENGFRDEVIESIFGVTLEYMSAESATLGYPELAVPAVINLRQYIKRCKNGNYSRKLKTLVDKLEENGRVVETARDRIQFQLRDSAQIAAWETQLRNKGTPLQTFYTNWLKTHVNKRKRQATESEDINDYNLPTINRKKGAKVREARDGPVDLFPSDDEDEDDVMRNGNAGTDDEEEVEEERRPAKKQKPTKPQLDADDDDDYNEAGNVDIVKDLDLNDW